MVEEPDLDLSRRLALALDVDDLVAAVRMARMLKGHFGVVKIGLELYSAAGPEAIGAIGDLGYEVFVDLKLHDIPTTVAGASRVIGSLGVSYLTMHAAGGLDMLRAGVDGLRTGAGNAGLSEPAGLAVTVLTSQSDPSGGTLGRWVELAAAAGCTGVVCAARDQAEVDRHGPGLARVVAGIRLPGDPADDQKRAASPGEALAGGADLIVVGRSVTRAADPLAAADRLHRAILGADDNPTHRRD